MSYKNDEVHFASTDWNDDDLFSSFKNPFFEGWEGGDFRLRGNDGRQSVFKFKQALNALLINEKLNIWEG